MKTAVDPEAQRIAWERDRNERAARHMMGAPSKRRRPLAAEHRSRVEAADEATLDELLRG